MLLVVTNVTHECVARAVNNFAIQLHSSLDRSFGLDLSHFKRELIDLHMLGLQIVDVGLFMGVQEDEGLALFTCSRGTTDAVHELVRPLWGVELDNPVHVRNVDTTRCQVSRYQQFVNFIFVLIFEFCVDLSTLLLIDFPVKFPNLFADIFLC